MTVLALRDVSIAYGGTPVVHDVCLTIARGECVGLVGESGCGKSTVALATMRALPRGGAVTSGTILIGGQDIAALDGQALRHLWARQISMVYQDPSRALNPTMTIAAQLSEAFRVLGENRTGATTRAIAALDGVRIPDPKQIMRAYPHQLSGGMQQRVVIAMALAKDPALLVLDEPTTGLDATVEAGILDLIGTIRQQTGTAILLISHNVPLVARMADRIGVLYAGVLVEHGPADGVLQAPRHPYTENLLRCLPRPGLRKQDARLETIAGQLPPLGALPESCLFAPRCHASQPQCETSRPRMHGSGGHTARCHFDPPFARPLPAADAMPAGQSQGGTVLHAVGLSKSYGGMRGATDISFSLAAGETLGLVGESGSGKTTLARMLLGLVVADPGGHITLDGRSVAPGLQARPRDDRKALQIVFQNPDSALNRAQTVHSLLARPVRRLAQLRGSDVPRRVNALAEAVRLTTAQLGQFPRTLSGGQKQRVAIARAVAGDPRVVICDEPTSALDASVQAAILNLLADLQRREGVSYLFISHDLNVVRYMSDRIAVLFRGSIVECGPTEAVFAGPNHPYTRRLLAAAARSGDEVPQPGSAIDTGAGCTFRTRCTRQLGTICETIPPDLPDSPHAIRCHIPRSEL
jgi:peptide/nickel transport system ATP-binding protein